MFRNATGVTTAAWILAGAAILFVLREASQLLIPIVLAALIAYALEPVVAWMHRHGLPRMAGAGLLLTAILALAGWSVYNLRDDAVEALDALPETARQIRELVWSQDASSPGNRIREVAEELSGPPSDEADSKTPSAGADMPPAAPSLVADWLQRGIWSLFALAGHVTVIFFLVFFLLISGSHFKRRIIEVAGPRLQDRRITATIIDDINGQIQRFLLVQLVTAVLVALATWAVLSWMEVEQAAIWAIAAGVFNSIPYFGPVVVSGGLLLVGLVQTGEISEAIKMSAAALAITSLEGWLLAPPLLGRAERMHAVVVFFGVLLWTWIWGAWGTILAVPMLVVVKSVADHVEGLKPLSRLMAP